MIRFFAPLLAAFLAVGPALAAPQPNTALKPPIVGLIFMGKNGMSKYDTTPLPDNSLTSIQKHPGELAGLVINLDWRQIEPSRGVYDWSALDGPLAGVAAYNAKYPAAPLLVRVRIWQGDQAPLWVKSLGGPPIAVTRAYGGKMITVGRFWSAPYLAAWTALLDAMAARYDANPLVVSVSNTACSSQTDEPFLSSSKPISVANLKAAGYTDAAQRACLLHSVDAFRAWKHTRIEYAFNLFHDIDSGGPKADPKFALQVMAAVRAQLGTQVELSNHAIRVPPQSQNVPIYQEALALSPGVTLQTAGPGLLTSWDATVRLAASYGASSLELWVGWDNFSVGQMQTWAALFARNPQPSP